MFTNDTAMHHKLMRLRDHGRNEQGEVEMWGLNSRLDNLHAAILDHKLARYDREIERRREIASLYHKLLVDIKELVLPPAPNSNTDHFDIYQNYEIEAERRDNLKVHLKNNGVGTLIQWNGKAVHQIKSLDFNIRLPYTEQMFTRCLMLPMNSFLSDNDIVFIAEKVRGFYDQD